jgi:hypothetical protein
MPGSFNEVTGQIVNCVYWSKIGYLLCQHHHQKYDELYQMRVRVVDAPTCVSLLDALSIWEYHTTIIKCGMYYLKSLNSIDVNS